MFDYIELSQTKLIYISLRIKSTRISIFNVIYYVQMITTFQKMLKTSLIASAHQYNHFEWSYVYTLRFYFFAKKRRPPAVFFDMTFLLYITKPSKRHKNVLLFEMLKLSVHVPQQLYFVILNSLTGHQKHFKRVRIVVTSVLIQQYCDRTHFLIII